MEALFVFLAMFAWSEADFLKTKNQQMAEGYQWIELENCRAPLPNTEHITIDTPIGNEYVCFKLVKE